MTQMQPHTLVHIGAGDGSNNAKNTAWQKQILIEPLPTAAEALRTATKTEPNTEVWELAISCHGNNQPAPFTEYNLAGYSGLQADNNLSELYPGIKVMQQHTVTTLTPAALLNKLQLVAQEHNKLIIHANGETAAIAHALAAQGQLTQFAELEINLASELYHQEITAAELSTLLEHEFDLVKSTQNDPEVTVQHWQKNQHKITSNLLQQELTQLQTKLEQSNTQLAEQQQHTKQLQTKLEQSNAQLAERQQHTKQLQTKLEQSNTQLAEQQQHTKQLQTKLEQSNTQLTEQQQHTKQLQTKLEKSNTQLAEQQQHTKQLQTKLEQSNTQLTEQQQHTKQLQTKLEQSNTQLAEQQQQTKQLQSKLEQSNTQLAEQQQHTKQLQSKLEQSNTQLAEQQQQTKQLQSKLEQSNIQLAGSEEELTKYKSYFQNRKKQHEAAEQQVVELTQQLNSANEQINQLTTQLQQQQQAGSKLSELEQKMEQLFASQAEQLRQNTNALGQHVTKMHASSNRQWQAALAVQHSLSFGEQPLQFSDTSISPELAQHLITLVQNNNYDLIIEFGSGHSTSLLARALLSQHKRWQGNGQLALKNNEPQTQLVPSEHDLPKRVISFEHNKNYHQQTQQSLQQQGLSEVVELVHAPLVNCTFSPEQLFYDCEPKLQQLAALFEGEEKRILVLVDGPSAEPTAHSRTPALPALLNHFARHRLDVVLDDHHRDSEQQSAEQWRTQLAERSLSFKEHIWAGDKSALLLSINP
ncbi:hypothetical protein AB9R84_11305 [Oceanimonas smirnovii]|uniref:hypothetical protein n=1 Tax=Oceanimonas smirnovii TaxID=264574 RepID=UPI003AAE463F